MDNKIKLVIVSIVVIMAAGAAYLFMTNQSTDEKAATVTNQPSPSVPAKETSDKPTTTTAGKYIAYSDDALSNEKGKRVLFFHAPWCPQCRKLDASIQAGSIPSDVTILKVDYDSNQKLRQQYGVTIQTTVVLLDENGKTEKKFVAYDDPSLQSVIENLF